VLDVGCGTGTFALMLADRGFAVTGLDPAKASLDIAKSKPGAEKLRWVLGAAAATSVQQSVDAVTMTGNVAQVFLSDEEWLVALQACHRALRAGGHLIFEARDPAANAWLGWSRDGTYRSASVDGVGEIACWEEVTVVEWPYVTFQTTFVLPGGKPATSTSTLRFRSRENILEALREAGFNATEVREAPRSARPRVRLHRQAPVRSRNPWGVSPKLSWYSDRTSRLYERSLWKATGGPCCSARRTCLTYGGY